MLKMNKNFKGGAIFVSKITYGYQIFIFVICICSLMNIIFNFRLLYFTKLGCNIFGLPAILAMYSQVLLMRWLLAKVIMAIQVVLRNVSNYVEKKISKISKRVNRPDPDHFCYTTNLNEFW